MKQFLPVTLLCLSVAAGCVEWSRDSQGNLQSIGLPGIPVWTASQPASATHAPEALLRAAELTADATGAPAWLSELNKWRELAGLRPVAENSELSFGSRQHARYIVKGGPAEPSAFAAYTMSLGPALHREEPSSPWYTQEGAEAAQGGKRVPGVVQAADVAFAASEAEEVDQLLMVPFHRLSLLAPWAAVAGHGSFGKYPRRAAALALRGSVHAADVNEIEFPPDGATIAMPSMNGPQWPDPLAACPGYTLPVGLPVTLQSVRQGSVGLTSYTLRDETDNRKLESCAFDADGYASSDANVEKYARNLLARSGAIILIPRQPLEAGHRYLVSIVTGSRQYGWTFGVAGAQATARSATAY